MTLGWAIVLIVALGPSGSSAAQSESAAATLPGTIPIFPLEDVVLFPNSNVPLHIFEPRYRAMVADALEGDSIIGMILLQPGHEAEYEGRPPIFAVGCAGVIIAAERLPDGRYDIVLGGLMKFRVLSEDSSRAYRLAEVEALPEAIEAADRPLLGERRRQLEEVLLSVSPRTRLPPSDLSDEEVVDGLSRVLPLEPAHRQELLEAGGPVERALRLIRRLRENASRAASGPGESVRSQSPARSLSAFRGQRDKPHRQLLGRSLATSSGRSGTWGKDPGSIRHRTYPQTFRIA